MAFFILSVHNRLEAHMIDNLTREMEKMKVSLNCYCFSTMYFFNRPAPSLDSIEFFKGHKMIK